MASVYKSSDEYFEYYCDPCKTFGDEFEAEGFCTVCQEYLCSICFRSHSRNKVTCLHTILRKDNMPRQVLKLCNPCIKARDEVKAVGYCENCCEYLCSDCYKSHTRNKFSRDHVLVKKEKLVDTSKVVTSAIARMNIKKDMPRGVNMAEAYTFDRDINVRSDTDKKDCYITCITLVSNYEIALCDCDNKCLKLVDVEENIIKDVLPLQSTPLGITAISRDQIAVVLDTRYQIIIVRTRIKLFIEHTIKTNGLCLDVKMMNKHMYVSFWKPVKFHILLPTGAIIKTIKPDDEVMRHCVLPVNIAVSPDETVIYVSDWKTNKVMSLDMNGNMLALFQGELEFPECIIMSPFGSVYVCNRRQSVVYKMKSDLSEAIVILGPNDGLKYPEAMCLNTTNQDLYLSSGFLDAKYQNVLKVYKC